MADFVFSAPAWVLGTGTRTTYLIYWQKKKNSKHATASEGRVINEPRNESEMHCFRNICHSLSTEPETLGGFMKPFSEWRRKAGPPPSLNPMEGEKYFEL